MSGYQIAECKVTSGYKLPANYEFHPVRLKGKNRNKLDGCYESRLQSLSVYNINYIAFWYIQFGILGFDSRKAAQMALKSARPWLESNHTSVDHVIFCTYENSDYEIYKNLMFNVYFLVPECHLSGNNMKEISNKCVTNVKNIENHNKLVQNISGLQIYPNTAKKKKSESPREASKRISR